MVVANPVTLCLIRFRQALSRNLNRHTNTNPSLWKRPGGGEVRRSKRGMENYEQSVDFDHNIVVVKTKCMLAGMVSPHKANFYEMLIVLNRLQLNPLPRTLTGNDKYFKMSGARDSR